MRFHGLDLNLLVVLDTLLNERTLTAAARRLNRTQPAVSAALGRLRDYFKDDLFVVSGRDFLPTPFALTLAQPVREALIQIQLTVIDKDAFVPATSTRTFRITVSDYMATILLDRVVRTVARQAPHVRFELLPFDGEFDEPLNRGEVDFLIFPDIYLGQVHPTARLIDEDLCAVTWAGRKRARLTTSAYLAASHVAARFDKAGTGAIEEWLLSQAGLRRQVDVVVPSFTLLPTFVVGTDRVATMHRRLARHFARFSDLRIERLPFNLPPVRETLQWPRLNQRDPASTWLRNIILAEARRLGGPGQVLDGASASEARRARTRRAPGFGRTGPLEPR